MKIVHISGKVEDKKKPLTKKENQITSARRWVAIQNQRNFRSALKEFDVEIREIQSICPGWLPLKEY